MEKVLVFLFDYPAGGPPETVLARVPAELWNRPDVHFLCIDDAASSAVAPLLRRWFGERAIGNATVLSSPVPQGHGGLQKLGYRFAIDGGFDFTVLLHGRSQAAPELLLHFIAERQRSGADVLLGTRVRDAAAALHSGMPLRKLLGSRLLTQLMNLATGQQLSDYHTGYRGYSTAFLRKVPFEANTNAPHFDTEILLQACYVGAHIAEVTPKAAPYETFRRHGLRYARDALLSTLQFKMHQLGMLCSLKYRDLQPEKYRDKTEMLYSSHAQVLALVAERAPQRLLDLGSGTGHVARRCRDLGVQVTGVDVRPPQPGTMTAFHRCDLDSEPVPVDPFQYDMVLLLDVIEHLSNPEEFLVRLRNQSETVPPPPCGDFAEPTGDPRLRNQSETVPPPPLGNGAGGSRAAVQMILSTPNVAFAAVRLNLLLGRFNYAERGILDITHKRLFTRSSLLTALRDCGYRVERVLPVGVPFEAVMGGAAARALGRLCHHLAQRWPTLFAFQFIVVCTPLPGLRQLLRMGQEEGREPEI